MTKILSEGAFEAWESDHENLVPDGVYPVKIEIIEPKETDPNILCFTFKITSGAQAGRTLRAWPSIAPDRVWTFKRLVKDVVSDPKRLQFEDLEGHIFKAEVTTETRRDNGEKTNRIQRLIPRVSDDEQGAGAKTVGPEDLPY